MSQDLFVPTRFHAGLHRFAVVLSNSIVPLIGADALARSEDTTLSVRDLPTSLVSIYKTSPIFADGLLAKCFGLEEQDCELLVGGRRAVVDPALARKAISA